MAGAGTFTVEQQCPQCGAPVTLEESDRFFSCDHCRVRLYIDGDDILRYYLPPSGITGDEILFVPYWHLRGTHYTLRASEVKSRVLDMSFQAGGPEQLPRTLGLRAQAMKLRYAVDGVAGRFLRPSLSYDEMVPRALKMSSSFAGRQPASSRSAYRAFLGSRSSLIYTPVYLRSEKIYDAVLDRPQCKVGPVTAEDLGPFDSPRQWQVKFVAALCPNCGWDLPGDKKGIIQLCTSCQRAWQIYRGAFHEIPFAVFHDGEDDSIFLPFWRMTILVEGLPLDSFADLARLANLPRALQKEWEERAPYFWTPAFHTRPRLFLRLAKQFTSLPLDEATDTNIARGKAHAVTLNAREAFDSIKLILADLVVPKRDIYSFLPSARIELVRAGLVYFPFAVQGGDFFQRKMKISIRKNALRP